MSRLICSLCLFGIVAGSMWAQPTGTALVREEPDVKGKIEGSVQVMEPDDVTLSGGARITGDLLVPGTPSVRLSGKPTYAGTLDGTGAPTPTKHRVTLNGSVELRNIVRRTNAVALPVVQAPPSPNGTRKVTLRRASDSVGDFATLKDLTLDGDIGLVAIPPGTYGSFSTKGGDDDDDDEGGGSAPSNGFTLGIAGAIQPAIYNFQKLSLSGKGTLRIVGPVIVTLKDKLSTGGTLGSAARPDWLKLRFSKGDLTLLGGAAVFAHLESPEGTLKLNGNTQFNGTVAVKKLTVNGQSILRLLALTSNQPPIVALTAPLDGATFEAPTTITLTATASDADGTIASVEFYRGSTKIGTATAPPYAFAWTDVAVGLYELTARAIDNAGASTISTAVNVQVTSSTLPFIANFETTEGYRLGSLHNQHGWGVTGTANIVTTSVAAGTQAVAVMPGAPATLVLRPLIHPTGNDITFVDFFVWPAARATPAEGVVFDTTAAAAALAGAGTLADWKVFHGDGVGGGQWLSSLGTTALLPDGRAGGWLRLTVREDYAAKRWDLYLNGRMIAADSGFINATKTSLDAFALSGHPTAPTGFDEFMAAAVNPLFADADRDGMDDVWELAHGLSPAVNDRAGDLDGDGLSNLKEYLLGTKPNNADTDGDGLNDAFELTIGTNPRNADTDGDGLPDGLELFLHLDPRSAADASSDTDGDGITDLAEYLAGSDPSDFYNGTLPQLTLQLPADGELGPNDSLSILVTDSTGAPLVNAPVKCIATFGSHLLAAVPDGPAVLELTVRSNAFGIVTVFVRGGAN